MKGYKKPILITCQPDDFFFLWQNHLYIESCLKMGFSEENIHILLFTPEWRPANKKWEKLKEYYPKLNIFYYPDKGASKHLGLYIPIIRPHILWQHFEQYPNLENETIIYTDCDILFKEGLDIEKFFDNDICYVSDASSYMNFSYFEKKKTEVLENKLEISKQVDPLYEMCRLVGIDKQIVIDNDKNIGGVQYILKGVNSDFWKKVEKDCLSIRYGLQKVNRDFYASENAGIQSWCSDLWAVIFNLWYLKKEVKVVPEMDFTWSSDPITKLEKTGIFHNAGIVGEFQGDIPVFYKGKYHNGLNPLNDPWLDKLKDDEKNKTLANNFYVNCLFDIKQKYGSQY